jgi:hypothetical protein
MKNEPAFPTGTGITPYKSGMTLRDYFAAKAMQALIQHHYFDVAAKKSYEVADAMLKARNENN